MRQLLEVAEPMLIERGYADTPLDERARASPVVAQFHDDYHQLLESQLATLAFEALVPQDEAPLAVAVVVTFVEGLLLHDHADTAEIETALRYLIHGVTSRQSSSRS